MEGIEGNRNTNQAPLLFPQYRGRRAVGHWRKDTMTRLYVPPKKAKALSTIQPEDN